MINIKVDNLAPIDIGRPDVIKTGYKASLTFKEIKDYFIKFLIQAEIPFSDPQRLTVTNMLKVNPGNTDEHFIEINNTSCYYTAICKLVNITVDDNPIFIVLLPDDYYEIEQRQRNKLMALKKRFNLLIFDSNDWKAIGLDISGKEWLKPLTKATLRKLVKLLFKKISQLGGETKSKYTLPEVYGNIEFNTADQRSKSYVVANLKRENHLLRKEIYKSILSSGMDLGGSYEHVMDALAGYSDGTIQRLDETVNYILEILNLVDFRRKIYRDLFMSKRKGSLVINSLKISDLIKKELSKKYSLDITNLTDTFLSVYNKHTFQTINLNIICNNRRDRSKLCIDSELIGQVKNSSVFTFVLNIGKGTSKINNIHIHLQYVVDKAYNIGMQVFNSKTGNKFCLYKKVGN